MLIALRKGTGRRPRASRCLAFQSRYSLDKTINCALLHNLRCESSPKVAIKPIGPSRCVRHLSLHSNECVRDAIQAIVNGIKTAINTFKTLVRPLNELLH
jgi:hypothetical protein